MGGTKEIASVQKVAEFLKRVDFFSNIPGEQLGDVAGDLEPIDLPQGTEIFSEGQSGDAMYFIVDGTVRIGKQRQTILVRGKGEYIGEMALIDDAPRSATITADTDIRLLRWMKSDFRKTLAGSGEMAYQVCRALSRKIRETVESAARIQQDLERATQLQRAMLPRNPLRHSSVEVAAFCLQADEIGGDYYDYLVFDKSEVALMIADAQGHGFSAALVVAMLKASLHSQAGRDPSPTKVVAALNRTLVEQIDEINTATCFYAFLDGRARQLHVCSAGHIPQYLYRADTGCLESLASENLLLGFQSSAYTDLRSSTGSWMPGDLLVLYSDGITEAQNSDGDEFGAERLRDLIVQHGRQEPRRIQEEILAHVQSYCAGEAFRDDVTLIAARLL